MSFITLIIALIIELTMTSFIASTDVSYNGDGKGEPYPTYQTPEQRREALRKSLEPLEQTIILNDVTWIGRLTEPTPDDSYNYQNYEERPYFEYDLVKAENGVETVMYTAPYVVEDFSSIGIETSTGYENYVILHHYSGGPEGGGTTSVVFKDGQELFRANVEHYGPFVNQDDGLSITPAGGSTHYITMSTKDKCEFKESQDNTEPKAQTELTGLTITTDNVETFYPIKEPKLVTKCMNIDGGDYSQTFLDHMIEFSERGIEIALPEGSHAVIPAYILPEVKVIYYEY